MHNSGPKPHGTHGTFGLQLFCIACCASRQHKRYTTSQDNPLGSENHSASRHLLDRYPTQNNPITVEMAQKCRAQTRKCYSHTIRNRHYTHGCSRNTSSNWRTKQQKATNKRQPYIGMHPDRHDIRSTSYGNDHVSSGTPPCGKSRCSHYQNDKKRTGIQTSGKSL